MTRRPDWRERLDAVLARWMAAEYDRVTSNCLLMIHEAIHEMTGVDKLAEIGTSREAVTTRGGMLRLLAQYGGSPGIVDAALGERIPRLQAKTGDVAMCPGEDEEAFGIVDGHCVVCMAHDGGLLNYPLANALAVWSV